jgi:hypothetical protein
MTSHFASTRKSPRASAHQRLVMALFCAVSGGCGTQLGASEEAGAEATAPLTQPLSAQAEALARSGGADTASLQQEISKLLWGCYVVGADLVGAGDVATAKHVLRRCFAEDLRWETVMPPAYAALAFSTTGGDNWVDVSNQLYRSLGIVRTQHLLTNVVVEDSGRGRAKAFSSALAVHVYADEHAFNATVKFEDELEKRRGTWVLIHRTMTVQSLTQAAAWQPQ